MKNGHIRFVNEIVDLCDLQEFENTLIQIVDKIENSNCRITTRTDISASSCQQSIGDSTDSVIRISLKNKRADSIEVIWDILHEYGHLISGARAEIQSDLEREIEAWKFANLELDNYPDLQCYVKQFNMYKQRCLETYINRDLN
jgi:hypothetical protein